MRVMPILPAQPHRLLLQPARWLLTQAAHPHVTATETLQDICELYLAREGGTLRSADWRKRLLDSHV